MLQNIIKFREMGDQNGWLVALEAHRNVPFSFKRVYYIYGTRPGVRRGKHAHRKLRQLLVCVAGSCVVLLDDGRKRDDVRLAGNTEGLLLEPMVWHEMYDFSPGCVVMVLADDWYDEVDYIRDYQAFIEACRR